LVRAMAPSEPTIEASFTSADFSDAEALVRTAGWNQLPADWEIFRDLGTVFVARENGRVIASAATLPYGQFAWISMVLVLPEHRQRSLGTRLLKRCVAALNEKGCVPVLDATPAGRPIYRALGFQDTWGFQRWVRPDPKPMTSPNADGTTVRPIVDADWNVICAYDAAAFGADRSALLHHLRGRLPKVELIAERRGEIAGFMLGRNGRSASQIGPLVAEGDVAARVLLARALSALEGPVYLDLADAKTDICAWLAKAGFTSQRPLTRMVLGRATGFEDTARTFAVVGPEFG
jgi:GNAT superfamily N-acetyltransferase